MLYHADLLIDQNGAPIFCLPQNIPQGKSEIILQDDAIRIRVDANDVAELNDINPILLTALSLKEKAGICVYEEGKTDIANLKIERIADIIDA